MRSNVVLLRGGLDIPEKKKKMEWEEPGRKFAIFSTFLTDRIFDNNVESYCVSPG